MNQLKYPKKSHRKEVIIPKPSRSLSEFFGIMIGDGGINNTWQANVTLNSEADAKFVTYVSSIIQKLFGVSPAIRKRKKGKAVVVSVASTTIVDFLVQNGLPRGNKLKGGLKIPSWIINKKSYRIACVRGLMDTDGCLFLHRHEIRGKKYLNIGLCFTSASPKLIEQVSMIFDEFGIIPHISGKGRNIYLYKEKAVYEYLRVFGTSNDRISSMYTKYRKWRDARAV